MKLRVKGQHALNQNEFTFEIPDNHQEQFGALWGFAVYEILDSIDKSLGHLFPCTYRHVRDKVHPAVDGRFIKSVIADMTRRGVLTVNSKGDITRIREGWETEVMG